MRNNPNTARLWDKMLFENGTVFKQSPFYIAKINKVSKFLEKEKGNLLDVGFGAGELENKLLDLKTKLNIYGIDFSQRAVKVARKTLKGNFQVSRAQRLPFKNSFFTNVVMLDVLEHVPKNESKKVLDEIYRVLRNNGNFVVSVPLNEDIKKMNKEETNLNRHLRQYTFPILKKELSISNFEVLTKDYIYPFAKFYNFKTAITKIFPKIRKPNLLIVYLIKK